MSKQRARVDGDRDGIQDGVYFFVPGNPVGWERAGRGRHGKSYTPARTRKWQNDIGRVACLSTTLHDLDMPLSVRMNFYLPRPKRAKFARPATKPDLDNLSKSVLDALEKANIIKNDSRVVELHVSSWYRDKNSAAACRAGVWVAVEEALRIVGVGS